MHIKKRLAPLPDAFGHPLGMGANRLVILSSASDDIKTRVKEGVVRGTRLTSILGINLPVDGIEFLRQSLLELHKLSLSLAGERRLDRLDGTFLISPVQSLEINSCDKFPEFGVSHGAPPNAECSRVGPNATTEDSPHALLVSGASTG